MVTLYKITATGATQFWEIYRDHKLGLLKIKFGQTNGVFQEKIIDVHTNQSGRSLSQQVDLEADSRINSQLDKGYRESIEEARSNIGLNAYNLKKPMLAQKISNRPEIDYKKCFVQYKYNGHRCLITNTGSQTIAYSRNGKPINTIGHILQRLNIPPGTTLDGELYIHGNALQDIGSMVRKVQEGNENLVYIVYDIIRNKIYEQRIDILCGMTFPESVHVAPTRFGTCINDLHEEMNHAINDGYEGLILRTNDKPYEVGKRSASLIKVKKTMDQEFKVIDIHESADGWAILECLVKPGLTFRVSAPGTIENKTMILYDSLTYTGQYINVEFFEWTNDGKPFHPVAMYWRNPE
jgi:ATP-dependent DNA ligase